MQKLQCWKCGCEINIIDECIAVSVEQAAEMLQLAPNTIQALLRCKKLKGVRIGRKWRIPVTEITAFMRSGSDLEIKPMLTSLQVPDRKHIKSRRQGVS